MILFNSKFRFSLYPLSLFANTPVKFKLLDIDLCGPSQPRILGCEGEGVHQSGSGWSPIFIGTILNPQPSLIHTHPYPSILIHAHPYSFILVHTYPDSSILVNAHTNSFIHIHSYYLSKLIHTHPYLSKLIQTHPYSSILIHTHPYSSILVHTNYRLIFNNKPL